MTTREPLGVSRGRSRARGRRWEGLAGLAAGVALALAGTGPAGANVIEVTLCTDTTPVSVPGELRHAISNSGGRVLILLPPCRITLTGAAGENLNTGGDLDTDPMTFIHLQGAGVDRTIIDGGQVDRMLDVANGVVMTVSDLTLTNGSAIPGGALKVTDSQVTLTRAAVTASRAPAGGFGGGADLTGSLVSLIDTTVADNEAGAGGGLALSGTVLTLEGSTISGNRATGEADSAGGGILASNGLVILTQTTVSGNRAEGASASGAGLRAFSTEVDALQVTVAANVAEGAAAAGGGVATPTSPMAIRGSIVAGNVPDNCGPGTPVTSANHNLQDGASCPFGQPGDQSQPDPGLSPLASHGGLTQTHLPLPTSPALDRGSEAGCPGWDQRGAGRPRDASGDGVAVCDVGAVERAQRGPGRTVLPRIVDPR